MNENDAGPLLNALSQCLSRMTHRLRTPLGVALSVLSDLADGHELGAEELHDGKAALMQIKADLDTAARFALKPSAPEPVLLDALLADVISCAHGYILLKSALPALVVSCDRRRTIAALSMLVKFMAEGTDDSHRLLVGFAVDGSSAAVRFTRDLPEKLAGCRIGSWSELAETDQRILGLAPLFAEAVFVEAGWRTMIGVNERQLSLGIEMPFDVQGLKSRA